MSNTHIVRFLCENHEETPVEISAPDQEKVTQTAYRAGVTIQQTCGGKAACMDCRVLVKNNTDQGLTPPTPDEIRQLGNVFFITKERLACQAHICGNVDLWIPRADHARLKQQKKYNKEKRRP